MAQKNESTKDLLFSKLLPALNNNPFSATYSGESPDFKLLEEQEDSLSALRSRLFARSETYESDCYATINVMENLVLKHIDQVMQRFNTCSCDRCRCDVAAYALNHLPPKYVVADPKRIAWVEKDIPIKPVMDALVNAVIQVKLNPRH